MDEERALARLRVLDLTGPAGSYAGKLFAELGADVLKVEPPGGDPGRTYAPLSGERSLHWWYHNTSKRSEIIDLTTPAGRQRLWQLVETADVLLDTDPWVLEAAGFTEEAVARRNRRLIWGSLTPFGLTGPRRHWKATDLIASALGGLLYLGGMPDRPPSWPGGEQSYLLGANALAVGVMLALLARIKTGEGQRVDVSLQEATLVATENAIGFWTFLGQVRRRLGTRSFGGPKMIWSTADGWVAAHIGGRWDDLLDWMETHGVETRRFRSPEWYDNDYRRAHFDEFEPVLQEMLNRLPKEQAYAEGQRARIVFGPIRTMAEVRQDIQLNARDFFVDLPTPEGPVTSAGAPYRLSVTPWRLGGPAPAPGEGAGDWREPPVDEPVRPSPPDAFGRLPLSGIRIVDFGTNVVVPLTCKLLASFGAEVIKAEGRSRPEGQRNTPVPRSPRADTLNTNWLFLNVNTDKRSLAVNMTVPEAQQLVREIIAQSDIVIDNFGVDPLPKWGMSAEELFRLRPDLIIVRCSVHGRTGPLSNYVGLGNSIMAVAGLNSITGFAGDPPVGTCTAHPDYSSNAHHALFSILAALYYRERTGRGQVIDLSQTESTVAWLGPALLEYTVNHRVPGQPNNRHPQMAPHGVYPAAGDDRWIAIACPSDAEWRALAAQIDPALLDDPRFRTLADRKANEDLLDALIRDWTVSQEPFALMERLQAAGVPAGVAQTGQDLVERDEHLAARGAFTLLDHEEAGPVTVISPHFRLSRTPGRIGAPPPLLGEDNDWVLTELLALDEERVAQLYIAGAVE
ncbi:MAG: CoA transferase [Chloroflexota bacterium]|nr:CoA transferase [Dehalococcoidia bacterium]MDW8253898.1 CoA transferase [Chloroflexota bacterium]